MRGTEHSRDTSKHLVLCDEGPRVSQHCSTHKVLCSATHIFHVLEHRGVA